MTSTNTEQESDEAAWAEYSKEWNAGGDTLHLAYKDFLAGRASQAATIATLQKRNAELEGDMSESFNRQFLDHFDDYEVWDCGDDSKLRVGDWVRLDYQDGNGIDFDNGVGRIVLHHTYKTPDIIMNIGFEDDGEIYGDYVGFPHPYNHIARISEETARAALNTKDA